MKDFKKIIEEYKSMWTTEKHLWSLMKFKSKASFPYLPISHIKGIMLKIREDEIAQFVVERMVKSGVRIEDCAELFETCIFKELNEFITYSDNKGIIAYFQIYPETRDENFDKLVRVDLHNQSFLFKEIYWHIRPQENKKLFEELKMPEKMPALGAWCCGLIGYAYTIEEAKALIETTRKIYSEKQK